mgnify:CR=1 FL=1
MYIISGRYKRRRLQFSGKIRPTQARVKESVFNVLGDITRKRVLDLCCGTGQNGLEALSRGALEAMFVDIDVRCVISNVNHLIDKGADIESCVQIKKKECRRFISDSVKLNLLYDLIFFDPPWMMPLMYEGTLNDLFGFDILSDGGVIVCEHPKLMRVPQVCQNYQTYFYGNTGITFFKKSI